MLEIMGVPPPVLANHPATEAYSSYPTVFRASPDLQDQWAALCLRVPSGMAVADAWNLVFRAFLAWAKRMNRLVFPDNLTRVDNNEIQSFLMLRRRWITQYLDRLKVLEGLHWINAETNITEDALGITVNSMLHCRDVDYDGLRAMFVAQNWRPNLNTRIGLDIGYRDWWRWIKTSETGITRVGFSAQGKMRAAFWYSVVVPVHPMVPPGTEVGSYVDTNIWQPVKRVLRFKTIKRICHF